MLPVFEIEGSEEVQVIPAGTSKSFDVTAENVADYTIQKPDGWKVTYSNGKLTVTSPVVDNTYAETNGMISVMAVSKDNKSVITKLEVSQLRVLTFEDADARFTQYKLDYCDKTIKVWSDLIDTPQYGGPMIYNDYSSAPYYWHDENNTGLFSELNEGGPFWMGGEVISNYYDADFKGKGFNDQLTVSVANGKEGAAGHNGSANFAVHNGYSDFFSSGRVGSITFADGVARVIDHMYVTNISYGLNSLNYGDGFNSAATANTWVKLCAIGYDEDGNRTDIAEFYLCKDGVAVNEWTRFDLVSLGKVVKVEFNFLASEDQSGSYGLNFPAYFAYDDVAVRF